MQYDLFDHGYGIIHGYCSLNQKVRECQLIWEDKKAVGNKLVAQGAKEAFEQFNLKYAASIKL
jgi:hypothetical protein